MQYSHNVSSCDIRVRYHQVDVCLIGMRGVRAQNGLRQARGACVRSVYLLYKKEYLANQQSETLENITHHNDIKARNPRMKKYVTSVFIG